MERVAVIGLGIMGRGMAINIAGAGYPLTVWNRTRSKTDEFAKMGARVADTPKDAAAGADIVITMLSDPQAVELVAFGRDGVIAGRRAYRLQHGRPVNLPKAGISRKGEGCRFSGFSRRRQPGCGGGRNSCAYGGRR